MKKKDRELIFNKFGGRCSYCGDELQKGWHIDHSEPIRRKTKITGRIFVTKDTGTIATEADIETGNYKILPSRTVPDGCHKPEYDNIENMMPACPSCNINKHSMNIEEFRSFIARFIKSLNKTNVQYKVSKRYGLIKETMKPVVFYFETLKNK